MLAVLPNPTPPALDRPVPYDLRAEEAVLGALLLDRDAIVKIAPWLLPTDFYREVNGAWYATILALYAAHTPADLVTLGAALVERGIFAPDQPPGGRLPDYGRMAGLMGATPTAVHVEHYAGLVAQAAAQRRLISAGGQVAALGYETGQPVETTLGQAVDLVQAAATLPNTHGLQPLGALVGQYYDALTLPAYGAGGTLTGVPTGLRWLDDLTGGLQPGNVYILAARPKLGKTSLALQWAAHAAQTPRPDGSGAYHVGFFSLEMGSKQLLQRLLAQTARVDTRRLQTGQGLGPPEWARVQDAMGRMDAWPLFIDDQPAQSIATGLARARQRHASDRLDLLVLDYLQLFSGPQSASRQEEVAAISRACLDFARTAGLPVLAISQLSRAAEGGDEVPLLSHLRESGALEQDAALVAFLTRDRDPLKSSTALLTVAANRYGPLGALPLTFDGSTTTFTEADTWHQE